ncbi:MAG: hypothetical protein V3V09_00430 [Arenicellales bacterium]
MTQKIFIPVSDEIFFDRPELISAPLRPYTQGMPCYHWLDVELNPEDDAKIAENFHHLTNNSTEELAA